MLTPDRIVDALSSLGDLFRNLSSDTVFRDTAGPVFSPLSLPDKLIEDACNHNPWFIPSFVKYAFSSWAIALDRDKIENWISGYETCSKPATVGIIMAGNIPLVGLHDLLCVLASGNRALIKLGSGDHILIPAVINAVIERFPALCDQVRYTDGILKGFDSVIATGSNNSSRYFEYYFGKYPHIIRKNRNGIAILNGYETEDQLKALADDIFIYFGMGCRNVSKIYIPSGFEISSLFDHFRHYSYLSDMHRYRNNYDYQKSIMLINKVNHLDNGFLLVSENKSNISPISVLFTEYYESENELHEMIESETGNIQCIITSVDTFRPSVPFGKSQQPELWDYADGIDTMRFLTGLRKK